MLEFSSKKVKRAYQFPPNIAKNHLPIKTALKSKHPFSYEGTEKHTKTHFDLKGINTSLLVGV